MAEVIVRLFQMSIVLEMAHRLDDINNQKQIPSKDLLVDKLIFNIGDVVLMEAKNVELDFANKGKLIFFFLKKKIFRKFSVEASLFTNHLKWIMKMFLLC